MISTEVLRLEAAHYRLLADQLKSDYGALDDETLADTLEGISELPQLIEEIVRSSLEDEALIAGLKIRSDAMTARLARFKARHERKRALAAWAMGNSGLGKLASEDFSVSLCVGVQKLSVADETAVPQAWFVPQPAKLDKTALTAALKRGEPVPGVNLIYGDPFIAVQSK